MSAPSLIVIGLDSATLAVIEPLLEAGELQHIGNIMGGAAGTLRSTTPPVTPQAWVTMTTGVNAAHHGVWDFWERDATGYDLVPINGSYRVAPAIWDYLAQAGRRVGLITVPFTWPAPVLPSGFVVSGFDRSDKRERLTHPEELRNEIERDYSDVFREDADYWDETGLLSVDVVRRACRDKVALARRLTARYEPELLFVAFMAADRVHHEAWPEWEERGPESKVASVYRALDEAVGELAALGDATTDIMLVSDHGAGPLKGVMSLNGWLSQEGYLAYRPDVKAAARRKLRRIRRVAARRLGRRGAVVTPEPVVIDWSRTRAFGYGFFGNVVINLRGRERSGLVDPAGYDALRDEIAGKALALRSASGERIVAAVHRREDICEGPHLDKAPDLILEFDDYAWLATGSLDTRTDEFWDPNAARYGARGGFLGTHRLEGTIALAGPSAALGVRLAGRIEDVAPTILYLLGEKIPSSLEGRVLTEAIDSARLDARPLTYSDETLTIDNVQESYSPAEAEIVQSRLRELGYLE